MKLSNLQQHILYVAARAKGRVSRSQFESYFASRTSRRKMIVDTITKTLERLIDRGFLVGYGVRTPKKWFIREVRVTQLGRRAYKETLFGRQKKLV